MSTDSSVAAFDRIAGTSATFKEAEIPRFGVGSLAVLSDVHANIHALREVLAELERSPVELVVFSGDITWGPFPRETVDTIRTLAAAVPVALVRGNGDRALLELAAGSREAGSEREPWMVANHRPEDVEWLRGVRFQVDVDVAAVGRLRICHGSPRADIEVLTPETPMDRLVAACAGVDADVLVTGHTHLQFERRVAGAERVRRHLNPGSVGLPYAVEAPGARWVRVDGGAAEPFRFMVTPYDLDAHLAAVALTDDPRREVIAGLLRNPPALAETIEYGEARVFSD
jgi:putative phosphoesterase